MHQQRNQDHQHHHGAVGGAATGSGGGGAHHGLSSSIQQQSRQSSGVKAPNAAVNNRSNNACPGNNAGGGTRIPRPYSDWKLPERYEVRHLIGTGSYGHVCEAWDNEKRKVVAIKKIHRVFEDLVDCKRILREIAILNRVKHENIVSILDIIVPENLNKFDEMYIVLEIADSDFKKLCRTPVYLTELHIKTLLYNLLVGLKYIHSAGIYHRDLKPANCLVNQNCSVKVCDFGLARTVDSVHRESEDRRGENREEGPQHGQRGGDNRDAMDSSEAGAGSEASTAKSSNMKKQLTGHVVTRWYRAPELILLQENYTEAIDIWSVGCIFAELMNMIAANCPHHADRGPLFPGDFCFPLSPDQKHAGDYKFHTRGNRDQLNVIFSILGTPSEEDILALEKDDARRYVRIFHARPPINLKERFPASSPEAFDLLSRMLIFNPKKRITVEESLNHPLFSDIRNPSLENQVASERVRLPFDDWQSLSAEQLRYAFLRETQKFHPEIRIPEHLQAVGYTGGRSSS